MDLVEKATFCSSLLGNDLLPHMSVLMATGGSPALVEVSTVPFIGFLYNSVFRKHFSRA